MRTQTPKYTKAYSIAEMESLTAAKSLAAGVPATATGTKLHHDTQQAEATSTTTVTPLLSEPHAVQQVDAKSGKLISNAALPAAEVYSNLSLGQLIDLLKHSGSHTDSVLHHFLARRDTLAPPLNCLIWTPSSESM